MMMYAYKFLVMLNYVKPIAGTTIWKD